MGTLRKDTSSTSPSALKIVNLQGEDETKHLNQFSSPERRQLYNTQRQKTLFNQYTMSSEAQNLKQEGNAAYKKKDFTTALEKYGKAIELEPNEITYYLNTAAVHFEMKNYTECISTCNKAIARMGNAYRKSGDLKNAKMAYEKALTEHRTPDYKLSLSEVEVEIKKAEEQAYINPELAEKEKEMGNALFKSGDFSSAVKKYTEAIKRNPKDPKLYSNRAACFTKLMSFDLALKDCEKCIELEPTFVKAY